MCGGACHGWPCGYGRLIAKAKKLGYQFALHATNTDGYMCSRLWDEDWVCKFADVPRIRKAWDEFVPVRHLQRELMTEHRTLAPGVFLTAYGDGSKTVCNYMRRPLRMRA